MREAFHLRLPRRALGSAAALFALSVSGCFALDWGSYRVGAGGGGAGGAGGAGGGAGGGMTCSPDDPVGVCHAIPDGWTAIGATLVDDASVLPGTCAGGSPRALYFTSPAAPGCSPCKCGADPAAKCSAPGIDCYFGSATCSGAVDVSKQPSSSGCIDLTAPAGQNPSGSCRLSATPMLLNPTCTSTGGAVTGAMWGGAALVCDVNAVPDGCGTGARCVPVAPGPDGPVCILRPGTDPCPAGWGRSIAAFSGGSDQRSCTACSCNIGCSGGGYVVHDANACADFTPPVAVNTAACVPTPDLFDSGNAALEVILATPTIVMCPGGQPTGQVKTTDPVRICCP